MTDTYDWRSDPLRDADETVRWRPAIPVFRGTWAGPAAEGQWMVGTPGSHVLFAHSPAGVLSLVPLLERPMSEVAAELDVTSLAQHGLGFERVVGLALDGGGRWAAFAILWLEDGFPMAGQTDALRRVISSKKSVAQRPRQTAARLLAAQSAWEPPHPELGSFEACPLRVRSDSHPGYLTAARRQIATPPGLR